MNAYTVMFETDKGSVCKTIIGRFGMNDLEYVVKAFHPTARNLKVLVPK